MWNLQNLRNYTSCLPSNSITLPIRARPQSKKHAVPSWQWRNSTSDKVITKHREGIIRFHADNCSVFCGNVRPGRYVIAPGNLATPEDFSSPSPSPPSTPTSPSSRAPPSHRGSLSKAALGNCSSPSLLMASPPPHSDHPPTLPRTLSTSALRIKNRSSFWDRFWRDRTKRDL